MPRSLRSRSRNEKQSDAEVNGVSASASASPLLNVAPTGDALVEKLKEDNRLLERENQLLKEERDFLREQLKDTLSSKQTGAKRKLGARKDDEDNISDTEDRKRKHKRKPESRRHKGWMEKDDFVWRVRTPSDVLQRYKIILRSYQRTKSISRSCVINSVDRNTIALTAIIAELQIIADATPELQIPEFQDGTLQQYAQRCRKYVESKPELVLKVDEMRNNHTLLPIAYKFRKADN